MALFNNNCYCHELNQHPHIHLSATRGESHDIKYLGHYLKRPPISTSQLKHYSCGTEVHHYYDHHSQQHRRQILSQEEMIRRYISDIPARHHYYSFLNAYKPHIWIPDKKTDNYF
ncbi:transposase [Providencia rettgeri]|nr:transposase [Providencia rettgeri]